NRNKRRSDQRLQNLDDLPWCWPGCVRPLLARGAACKGADHPVCALLEASPGQLRLRKQALVRAAIVRPVRRKLAGARCSDKSVTLPDHRRVSAEILCLPAARFPPQGVRGPPLLESLAVAPVAQNSKTKNRPLSPLPSTLPNDGKQMGADLVPAGPIRALRSA